MTRGAVLNEGIVCEADNRWADPLWRLPLAVRRGIIRVSSVSSPVCWPVRVNREVVRFDGGPLNGLNRLTRSAGLYHSE